MSAHGAATALNRESLDIFFLLFIYKLTQLWSVENVVLYHKNIMKIITIWYMVVGISISGVRGFVVCVVGVWGCRQAINRLKINRLFWRNIILTTRKTRSGLGQSLTLIEYSSGFPEIAESGHPLRVTAPTDPCLKSSVYRLQAHQKTQSQWYQRFDLVTKLQI